MWPEEVFGPVAGLYRVSSYEEAVELANATSFGLGANAWTNDPAEQAAVHRRPGRRRGVHQRHGHLVPRAALRRRSRTPATAGSCPPTASASSATSRPSGSADSRPALVPGLVWLVDEPSGTGAGDRTGISATSPPRWRPPPWRGAELRSSPGRWRSSRPNPSGATSPAASPHWTTPPGPPRAGPPRAGPFRVGLIRGGAGRAGGVHIAASRGAQLVTLHIRTDASTAAGAPAAPAAPTAGRAAPPPAPPASPGPGVRRAAARRCGAAPAGAGRRSQVVHRVLRMPSCRRRRGSRCVDGACVPPHARQAQPPAAGGQVQRSSSSSPPSHSRAENPPTSTNASTRSIDAPASRLTSAGPGSPGGAGTGECRSSGVIGSSRPSGSTGSGRSPPPAAGRRPASPRPRASAPGSHQVSSSQKAT